MSRLIKVSFKALPSLKEGIFAAAMVISSPVWGLRPLRFVLALTSNEPQPIKVTPEFLEKP